MFSGRVLRWCLGATGAAAGAGAALQAASMSQQRQAVARLPVSADCNTDEELTNWSATHVARPGSVYYPSSQRQVEELVSVSPCDPLGQPST